MQVHQLTKPKNLKSRRRIGRGGKRGTFSGRGVKGQKSRAGARIRPQIRDYIKSIPKLRGGNRKSSDSKFGKGSKKIAPVFIVNTGILDKAVKDGDIVNAKFLQDKKLVRKYKGRLPRVKLLVKGELKKKITVEGLSISASARKQVESAGGKIL